MNIFVCDDDKLLLASVKQMIMHWAEESGHTDGIVIHAFTSSEDLLEAWYDGIQADALFLDIQIPGEMNGLALAKRIHEINEHVPVVFITNYGEYAEEGYTVNALRYLRKPLSECSVNECMNIIWRQWTYMQSNQIVFDLSNQKLCLPSDRIIYIEVYGHYCMLKTADGNGNYKLRMTLEQAMKKLPAGLFVQCQRSFVVNIMYIRHMTGNKVVMADGTEITLGKAHQARLMKEFRHFYLEGDAE